MSSVELIVLKNHVYLFNRHAQELAQGVGHLASTFDILFLVLKPRLRADE